MKPEDPEVPVSSASDENFGKLAAERSHADAKSAGDYGRAVVQFAVASNGLAVTGILGFIGAMHDPALALMLVPALLSHSFGIFLSLRAAHAFFWAQAGYANMWMLTARQSYGLPMTTTVTADQNIEKERKRADQKIANAIRALHWSISLFLIGAGTVFLALVAYPFVPGYCEDATGTRATGKLSHMLQRICEARPSSAPAHP